MLVRVNLNNPEPQEKRPFLWQSQGGCVYLRNREGRDIVIGPCKNTELVGEIGPATWSPRSAWSRRLQNGDTVALTQDV